MSVTATYAVFHQDRQYDCAQEGDRVAIFNAEGRGELMGHIPNLVIPDEDEQHVSMFESAIKSWLNYHL